MPPPLDPTRAGETFMRTSLRSLRPPAPSGPRSIRKDPRVTQDRDATVIAPDALTEAEAAAELARLDAALAEADRAYHAEDAPRITDAA